MDDIGLVLVGAMHIMCFTRVSNEMGAKRWRYPLGLVGSYLLMKYFSNDYSYGLQHPFVRVDKSLYVFLFFLVTTTIIHS
jgi:hypothetical protein